MVTGKTTYRLVLPSNASFICCHSENVVVIPHRTCGTNELIIVEENTHSKRTCSTIPGGQIIKAWWVDSLNWH